MDLCYLKQDPNGVLSKHLNLILRRSLHSFDLLFFFFSELQWCQSRLKVKQTRRKSGMARSTNRRPSLKRPSRWFTVITLWLNYTLYWVVCCWVYDYCLSFACWFLCLRFRNGQVQISMASSNYLWEMSSSLPALKSTLLRKILHQSPL